MKGLPRCLYVIIIVSLILIMSLSMILSSCEETTPTGGNNHSSTIGSYEFRHVNISNDIESHCFDISKWYTYSDNGIEVKIEDGYNIFLSEGTYILFQDPNECPFCNGGDK